MKHAQFSFVAVCSVLISWSVCATVFAGAFQPAADPAGKSVEAVVLEVQGKVRQAPVGIANDAAGWKDVAVNDRLSSGTQIKTSFRSFVTLKFGDDTVVQIKKATLASIDSFVQSDATQDIKLGLAYGTVRGGSSEGRLRTDLEVESTVATLAKRGTEGWQIVVEPSTAHFNISLSRSGLVEALSKLTGRRKTVAPGQYADANNIMKLWINQALFDRTVQFYSDASQSETEVQFSSRNQTGNAVLTPGSGTEASQNSGRNDLNSNGMLDGGLDDGVVPVLDFVNRPEGDFGIPDTFQGLFSLPLRRADLHGHDRHSHGTSSRVRAVRSPRRSR